MELAEYLIMQVQYLGDVPLSGGSREASRRQVLAKECEVRL